MFAGVIHNEAVSQGAARTHAPAESGFSGSPNEAEAIQAAQAGDLDAFNRLVLAHQDGLYGWTLSLVKDPAAAADITQAAFIAAYENLHRFRGGSLRAWLFAIARNRSIDELRRSKRRPALSLDSPPGGGEGRELLESLPVCAPRPDEACEAGEQARLVERLLASLPEPFQQALRLVDLDEMNYHEAAQALGLPEGTLKSRLARARQKLRALLAQSGYLV